MIEEQIKTVVKEIYAAKVEQSDQWYPYCFASQSAFGAFSEAELMGYSKEELESIPSEAVMGLGCGNPMAIAGIEAGATVIDLGCGGGIDVFLASKKVGNTGKVIGIDITSEMINKARTVAAHHNYKNVEFRLGEFENIPVENDSADYVISNCAINLSTNKSQVFTEMFRVLKPGGQFVVCDNVIEGTIKTNVEDDLYAWACCITGAIKKEDYLLSIAESGFVDIVVESVRDFTSIDDRFNPPQQLLSISVRAKKAWN